MKNSTSEAGIAAAMPFAMKTASSQRSRDVPSGTRTARQGLMDSNARAGAGRGAA
jgi:hypothetical protein